MFTAYIFIMQYHSTMYFASVGLKLRELEAEIKKEPVYGNMFELGQLQLQNGHCILTHVVDRPEIRM